MHRCWLASEEPLIIGQSYVLSAEESAHVARVLRMKEGQEVQLIAAECLYHGKLVVVDATASQVIVLEQLPSPECPVHITLIQGLPKQDKLEMIVQKATEIGAWDVFPVEMERSVARLDGKEARKQERLQRIAAEAAKQSGRARVLAVHEACRFDGIMKTLTTTTYDAVFVAWEQEDKQLLSQGLAALLAIKPWVKRIALVIGPEGGISENEIALLNAVGAQCVTLGKRILRTETAGLCALAVMMAALGEM